MSMSYFPEDSVLCGLQAGSLAMLSETEKRIVIVLLSRISEKAYRRGFQQGYDAPKDELLITPDELSNEWPLTKSPFVCKSGGYWAIERLMLESPEIESLFDLPI